MELHRQTCQACGSIDVRNILRRTEGHQNPTVFVRCARCHSLVARYELATYYHHGKGIESWLRGVRGVRESGRALRDEFRAVSEDAEREYAEALQELAELGKEV